MLPQNLQLRDQDLQLALRQRDEEMQLALCQRNEEMATVLRIVMKQHGEDMRALHEEYQRQHLETIEHFRLSMLQDFSIRFANFTMQIAGHIRTVVVEAVSRRASG